jgi:hypothetical protein
MTRKTNANRIWHETGNSSASFRTTDSSRLPRPIEQNDRPIRRSGAPRLGRDYFDAVAVAGEK